MAHPLYGSLLDALGRDICRLGEVVTFCDRSLWPRAETRVGFTPLGCGLKGARPRNVLPQGSPELFEVAI
jgi:hypothetical protein